MSEKLKPCPFCGGPAKIRAQYNGNRRISGYYVNCNKRGCPIFTSTRVRKTKEEAKAEWNTRAVKDNVKK